MRKPPGGIRQATQAAALRFPPSSTCASGRSGLLWRRRSIGRSRPSANRFLIPPSMLPATMTRIAPLAHRRECCDPARGRSLWRNQNGETARAGGRGPNVSDEGSAFWVGREAVTLRCMHSTETPTDCWPPSRNQRKLRRKRIRMPTPQSHVPELAGPVVNAADREMTPPAPSWSALARRWRLASGDQAVCGPLRRGAGCAGGGVLQGSSLVRHAFREAESRAAAGRRELCVCASGRARWKSPRSAEETMSESSTDERESWQAAPER